MAHPYNDRTALEALLGTTVVAALLDRDQSGAEDTGVYTAARERADRKIDGRLAQRYGVPFVTTPDLVATISDHLTAADLLAQAHAESQDVRYHKKEAEDLLVGILAGKYDLPGAALVEAESGSILVSVDSADPQFSGRDDDDDSRMSGW